LGFAKKAPGGWAADFFLDSGRPAKHDARPPHTPPRLRELPKQEKQKPHFGAETDRGRGR